MRSLVGLERFGVSIHAPRFREAMPDFGAWCGARGLFQSTPPVSGRRCLAAKTRATRPCCFNPRPPFPGGDARAGNAIAAGAGVSIHAPRFREAMPGRAIAACRPSCSFNPRPPFPGGDATTMPVPTTLDTSFNPRPPFPGGDAAAGRAGCRRSGGFNPRPPFPGGDAHLP